MNDTGQIPRVVINVMRGCLVATIQIDLNPAVLEQFRKDLLEQLAESRARHVILDCSGVEVLDAEDFDALRRTISMASLLGARAMLAGLRPGVVSALVECNVDIEGLDAVLSVDDAFRLLGNDTATAHAGAIAEGGKQNASSFRRSSESRLPVGDEIELMQAVMCVGQLAQHVGFTPASKARLMTSVSELARNILKYADKGTIVIARIDKPGVAGIEVAAVDRGPGMADPDKALQDHFSTSGTLGLGLPGVRRMMDEFEIESAPKRGTSVTIRKWLP